jgi:hypothetical protein
MRVPSPIETVEPNADSTRKDIHISLTDTNGLKVELPESKLTDISGVFGKSTKSFGSLCESANPDINPSGSAERSVPRRNQYLGDVCIVPNRLDFATYSI